MKQSFKIFMHHFACSGNNKIREKSCFYFILLFFRFELTVDLKHVNGNAEEIVLYGNVGFHPQIDSKFRTNILPPKSPLSSVLNGANGNKCQIEF